MDMNQKDMEQILINIVCNIQKISGREEVPVTADTKPVLDIPGFDSLNGVEATVEVLDQLGIDLDFNNVFVEDDSALTIQQAATRLINAMAALHKK